MKVQETGMILAGALALACGALAGCTGPAGNPEPGDEIGQDDGADAGVDASSDGSATEDAAAPTPNPRDVQLTLDPARKASVLVSPEGGVLSVSAADGTSFELSVPAGALLSDATMSMTPILRMEGSGLGEGPQFAVHLEPEGLEFLEPVTLTIHPASLSGKQVIAFNSHEMGREFYLQPHSIDSGAIVLTLQHFSNPGAALLEVGQEFAEGLEIVPSDARDQFEHELGLDLTRDLKQAAALTGRYYGKVRDKLESAASDPSQLKSAIRSFLTFRKEVSRLGFDELFTQQIYDGWKLIAEGIDSAIVRARTSCSVNSTFSDFIDILGWITWIKRNPKLAPYFEGKLAQYEALAQGCATFELEFDYTQHERAVTLSGGEAGSDIQADLHVSTKLEVSYSFEYAMLVGRAPMVVESYTASGFSSKVPYLPPECPSVTAGEVAKYEPFAVGAGSNGKSHIPLVSLLIDVDDPDAPASELQTLTLFLFPSLTVETFNAACAKFEIQNGNIGGYVPSFLGLFGYLNDWSIEAGDLSWWRVPFQFESDTAEYNRDHDYKGPDPVFEKSGTTLTVKGKTHLKLRHTPR